MSGERLKEKIETLSLRSERVNLCLEKMKCYLSFISNTFSFIILLPLNITNQHSLADRTNALVKYFRVK